MSALASPERPEAPLFSDGIGDRVVSTDPTTGDLVQVLRINPALTAVPSFEFALRERVARLANFRHTTYARVRRVDRAAAHATALSLVSDHVEGTRLSEILRVAEERGLQLDINAALCLIRQLVPALALLHENARDTAHGLVAPERLIITPQGRLVIAEHVCGAAVEQMQYGRERLWHECRVAMPPSAGIPRFDQRGDVTGVGVVALSLVLGRPLRDDEFPRGVGDLLNHARERTALGEEQPLAPPLRSWLARALQVDARRAFASAPEALAALDEITADGSMYVAAPVALETFLSRYISALLVPPPSVAAPALRPAEIAGPSQAASPVRSAPDVTELLTEPLPAPLLGTVRDGSGQREAAPLFNAAAPFSVPNPPATTASRGRGRSRKWFAVAAVLVILATGGIAGFKVLSGDPAPALATLTVQSNPAGVPVFVDGIERGVTPARITLAAGAHILELRRGVPRVIPVTLAAGADVSQYLEFVEAPIAEEPVITPGTEVAPVPEAPASAPVAPLAGWIAVKMPFGVEILEKGRLIGSTQAERLMLAAGPHELEFVNESLGYRATRLVHVIAGKVTTLPLEVPRGMVNLNAAPWAEVFLDGQSVGETPIGNLSVPIGPHEILFRHPQFGEKRHAVSVTAGVPVRISVEMK
ncbi:MAG TPA: PEGA domain-containing protein [Vicinamibacterales bacterium]|nr:PEGA domain-containing protein [Vicinamibacterales bacterium]